MEPEDVITTHEDARLRGVHSYDMLLTAATPTLDSITALASELFEVPTAFVSLVGGTRQWFKSRVGFDLTEIPRSIAICSHIIGTGRALVIEDAADDPRFRDNPLVVGGPKIRFYAGVPLRSKSGFDLGTVVAIDHVPRRFAPSKLDALNRLSEITVNFFETQLTETRLSAAHGVAEEAATRYSALFDAMDEGVTVVDEDGVILSANKSAERILGSTREDIVGHVFADPMSTCFKPDGTPFTARELPFSVALRTRQPQRGVLVGVRKPTGQLAWISINAIPVEGDDVHPSVAVTTFHDITTWQTAREDEERLERTEQAIAMGTLVAGLNHEINNPLTYVTSNIEYARDELDSKNQNPAGRLHDVREALSEARDGAERIRGVVRAIKALGVGPSRATATSVERVIEEAIAASQHVLRERAVVVTRVDTRDLVLADEARLASVIAALLHNAAQALPVTTKDTNRIEITAKTRADGRVVIAVTDNGPGVPAHLHRRIFDPFFTTDSIRSGAGLGLSVARTHARSMGADLDLVSVEPHGASFQIVLLRPET